MDEENVHLFNVTGIIRQCGNNQREIHKLLKISTGILALDFVYLERRVSSAAWLSLSLLLMDLVVTERVVFCPVTVSAPQSSSSL